MARDEPKMPPPQPDDPAEYERFLETARKLGVDESPDALDRAFERVVHKPEKRAKPLMKGVRRK